MSVNVKGLDELNKNLKKLRELAPDVAKKEIADIALDLGGKASNAAPILVGDLRGELANPQKINDFTWKVGSSLPYAMVQHECLWFNHPRGGGPKFLENPFNENKELYVKQVQKEIKKAIQSELR